MVLMCVLPPSWPELPESLRMPGTRRMFAAIIEGVPPTQWGNVGDPQPTQGEGLEVAPGQVGRALLSRRAVRGARGPGATDAA